MLARTVQVSTSLLTMPFTLKYLGTKRFGLWMTMSSVLAMAAFADFGVGNGVSNTVAKASWQDDILRIRRAVSSGLAILGVTAAVVLAVFFSIFPFVNWANTSRVASPTAMHEAQSALAVFVTCFALNTVLDTVHHLQLGVQQGYRYAAWQMTGSLAGFLGVLLLLGLAIPSVLDRCVSALTMCLNGTTVTHLQIVVACMFSAGWLVTKLKMIRECDTAVGPWCTVSNYLLRNVLPSLVFVPRTLGRLRMGIEALEVGSSSPQTILRSAR